MNNIVDYIKERIEELRQKLKEAWVSTEYFCISEQISELQAVLSKIEELETIEKHRKAVKMFRQTSNQELNK